MSENAVITNLFKNSNAIVEITYFKVLFVF